MKTMIDSMAELHQVWDKKAVALSAEIPSLNRIKELQKQEIKLIASVVKRLMDGEELPSKELPCEPRVKLKVFTNTTPAGIEPDGICSPIKTDAIFKFEESIRDVFGEVESSTTAWPAE